MCSRSIYDRQKKPPDSETKTQLEIVAFTTYTDPMLYAEFDNNGGSLAPFYTSKEWMDEDGVMLFPYKDDEADMNGIDDIIARMYIPNDVLDRATTEDLLYVVCDCWLSTGATASFMFNFPSDYIVSCTVCQER